MATNAGAQAELFPFCFQCWICQMSSCWDACISASSEAAHSWIDSTKCNYECGDYGTLLIYPKRRWTKSALKTKKVKTISTVMREDELMGMIWSSRHPANWSWLEMMKWIWMEVAIGNPTGLTCQPPCYQFHWYGRYPYLHSKCYWVGQVSQKNCAMVRWL